MTTTEKNKATIAATGVSGVELIEIPASYAEFALACGLAHDAPKGDVLAKMSNDKADVAKAKASADASSASLGKLLDLCSAKTAEEAIGKLTAQSATLGELVKAICGDDDDKATAQDAIAKLAADRKSNEATKAKSLIEKAVADGKTAGEKAFGIFEKYGMSALESHLDALNPHEALVNKAPTQKADPTGTAPTPTVSADAIVLSADDKRVIKLHGLDEQKFIETRREEMKAAREIEDIRNS